MSITAVNLTDGIRVDQATHKGSVNDVIALVTGKKGSYVTQVFSRIRSNTSNLYQNVINSESMARAGKLQ